MKYIDVHAHYDDEKFNVDMEEELKIVRGAGVKYIINAGSGIESSKKAIEIAKTHDYIFCTIGIHPEYTNELNKVNELEIMYNRNKQKIVAIGEIGLDYHYTEEDKEKQKELFISQMKIAKKLNLPIQIHSRDAVKDMLEILNHEEILPEKIMFHCYELNEEITKVIIKRGYSVSLGGNITYKRRDSAINQIKEIPLSQIMLETDSPYLAPQDVRGTRNSSKNLHFVAEKIAEIKGITLEEVIDTTYNNAVKFYNLPE